MLEGHSPVWIGISRVIVEKFTSLGKIVLTLPKGKFEDRAALVKDDLATVFRSGVLQIERGLSQHARNCR